MNNAIKYSIAVALLISATLIAISIGTVSVPIVDIVKIIGREGLHLPIGYDVEEKYISIVYDIRLPRVLLAGFVGASLAISGAAFQGLLRNPLAEPYLLGVSSGASLGAVATIFFGLSLPVIGNFTLPLFSICCAFLIMVSVLYFAKKIDQAMRVETIILTGIIFSSFLASFISLIIALTGDELQQIIGWLLGSVSMRGWRYVAIILPFFIIGSVLLMMSTKELNAMSLGEERAQHLGVDVARKRLLILIAGSTLTGAAVAVSGMIGFVGLVIPHLVRKLCGPDHVHLLPLSMLIGAAFLILTDLVSRTIISPQVLPVGVITALIGAPVFAMILLRQKRESRGEG